jgi:heme/copper-type cytochrome/quinol oxidase subunit 1
MRLQLIVPENSMIQPEIFNRLLSTAPVTLVVLAAVPLALGLIAYIAPLQIGARGVALPRLHQLSYWLYLVGGVTLYTSFLWAAPESGTIGLPPLSDAVFTPTNGTDAWIAGTALATLGFVCFGINLVVTLNRLRAPGIAWRRMPLFSWAAAVIGWLLVVIGPMMIAALTSTWSASPAGSSLATTRSPPRTMSSARSTIAKTRPCTTRSSCSASAAAASRRRRLPRN